MRGSVEARSPRQSILSLTADGMVTTALWGFCVLIVCGVALLLGCPDLTFPRKVLGKCSSPMTGLTAGAEWLIEVGTGSTKWLPLVRPACQAAR